MKYVAFLRGINVSGHHKVPMIELHVLLEKLKCKNTITILNSGNVIFESKNENTEDLEQKIAFQLEKTFGFSIPTILFTAERIQDLINNNPFKDITLTKDVRFYVSFLLEDKAIDIKLPCNSEDNSFKILEKRNNIILSVLDVSQAKTTKAMMVLERNYGKNMTTRNWNTILRIEKKLQNS